MSKYNQIIPFAKCAYFNDGRTRYQQIEPLCDWLETPM
jgi:hypothetical protein